MFWILVGGIFYFACLFWHAHKLFSITTKKEAWKLVLLRGLAGLFFLILILRPFVDRFELNPDAVRLVSLVDFSGSMDRADREGDESRINQVLPFFDLERSDSWINQAKARYGSVDRLGFAGDEVSAMRASSTTGSGLPTAEMTFIDSWAKHVLCLIIYVVFHDILQQLVVGRTLVARIHCSRCDPVRAEYLAA